MAKRRLQLLGSNEKTTDRLLRGTTELVNLYLEQGSTGLVAVGTPGISQDNDIDGLPVYAAIDHNSNIYLIRSINLLEIKSTGEEVTTSITSVGSRCSIAALNDEIIWGNGEDAFSYVISTATDSTIDVNSESISYVTTFGTYGIFLVKDSAKVYNSSSGDATTVSSLDFFNFQADGSNPVAAIGTTSYLYILGETASEIRYNSGAAVAPFELLGGSNLPLGCAAKHSVRNLFNKVYFLGKDKAGLQGVVEFNGTDFSIVSEDNFVAEIKDYIKVDDAFSWSDNLNGHTIYNITFPSAETVSDVDTTRVGVTWSYDLLTGVWFKRSSYNSTTKRHERHRANHAVFFQNKQLIVDRDTENLYELSFDNLDDSGNTIRGVITTPTIRADGRVIQLSDVEVLMEPSQGAVGETPQLMLEVSKDGGHTYDFPRPRTASAVGQYQYHHPIKWSTVGSGPAMTLRFTISSGIKRLISNLSADVEIYGS